MLMQLLNEARGRTLASEFGKRNVTIESGRQGLRTHFYDIKIPIIQLDRQVRPRLMNFCSE